MPGLNSIHLAKSNAIGAINKLRKSFAFEIQYSKSKASRIFCKIFKSNESYLDDHE